MQLTSSGSLLPNQGAISVSAALIVPSETESREATPAITKNASVSEKSRKRKKVSAPEGLVPKISVSQPQGLSASSRFINLPNSAELSLYSNSSSTVASAGHVSAASHPITMPYYQILGSSHTQQRGIFIKEACNQIEQSKLQAENASAYAASAVRHSQVIWEQMAIQRKSGLALEVEQKLASAAVAAAAAASVAKVAAEVAKVASEAAVQAKLMADETLNSLNTGTTQNSEISLDIRKNLLTSTPVLIPKSQDKIHGSCSIISTAREATRKRAEATSAAIKRAENLDAILKCAEMAAEAVSQAGTVITMGDPLPSSICDLVEAGPEGCNLENGSQTIPTVRAASEPMQGSNIQKGSLVEVVADEDGLRGAWFSAQVLDVKDGKAYVCYKDLLSDEGNEKLKEWIPLESKSDQPPRIRVAHPVIVTKSEGTRKRQREVAGNCTWAVGDRGDTPYGKRAKLGQFNSKKKSETGEEGMTTLSSNIHTDDSRKLEELRPLNLSAKDLTFSVGSNVREDNNNDVFKVELTVIEPLRFLPGVLSLEKKSSAEAEMGEKEKENDLPFVDKSSRSDIKGSEIPGKGSADVVEPRRSNRRIQPTSRLLEGLQSSLIVSKSPHDRGGKSLHRGVSASRDIHT
ncbi:Agenet domain [Musa troglodytarum]|uniref:Agenet domain n=1 Tax=Musa troglodytarum TaxID=320322 RepID=A0A9E7FXC6_9LILI|nr:Agenet domain [Musa troglodytarum]